MMQDYPDHDPLAVYAAKATEIPDPTAMNPDMLAMTVRLLEMRMANLEEEVYRMKHKPREGENADGG